MEKAMEMHQQEDGTFWLFGEMEIDPKLSVDQMYRKAFRTAEHCGYMVEKFNRGYTPVIRAYDNDRMRYFDCTYEAIGEPGEFVYRLTKIECWSRGTVWNRPTE